MPVRKKGTPIVGDRGLLIGDAAGLIDAVTGEGIYCAVRSAQLAAAVIMKFLAGGLPDLQGYKKAIDDELMPELRVTRALAIFITLMSVGTPRLFFKLAPENEQVWRALCRIVRGEKTYVSVKQGLGRFQFLFDLLAR
jgi:flavin-dependent dehydrogenase